MAGGIGGSVLKMDIGGRNFSVAADGDVGVKLGGFENEVQSNGDGSVRVVKTRVPWSLDGVPLSINHDVNDLQYLQDIADGKKMVPISITMASGDVYNKEGTITGEVKMQTQNATAPLSFAGPGRLGKQ